MSEPSDFTRPDGWTNLGDPAPQPTSSTPSSAPPPGPERPTSGRRRRTRWLTGRARNRGLGAAAAGPEFHWPDAPAGPAAGAPAVGAPPAASRRPAAGPSRWSATARTPRPRKGASPLLFGALVPLVMIVVLFAVLSLVGIVMRAVTPDRPRPVPTTQRTTPAPTLPVKWTVTATQLRPDLTKPELLSSTDGLFDDSRAIDAGTAWLVLTGDANDTGVWVHGLDPSTGRELWKRDLPDGLCAAGLVGKAVLCASAIEHDDATGLGTSWHLARLDPATGRELSGTDWTGWLTLVHADRDRVLLVEQRQPAPHAVLTVLNADLEQRAQFDLRAEPQHAGLFSDNRIVNRKLPIPDGPALDRPRIRKVADGLTALWVGQSTAFVDLAKGTLIDVPRCSRLVDDGTRLWCNQGAVAAALGYSLKPLFETDLNTRLAFPNRDPRAGDVTDPVFLQQTGLAVRVNPSTGRTIGPLVNTRNGSAFGTTTSPQTAYLRGVTLVWDSSTLFAVKARTGELLWQLKDPGTVGDPWNWKGRILLAHRNLRILDPASGRVVSAYRQGRGLYTEVLGDALIAVGPDELALLVDP